MTSKLRADRVDKLHLIYRTHSSLPFCNGLDLPDGSFPRHLDVVVQWPEGQVSRGRPLCRLQRMALMDQHAVIRGDDRAIAIKNALRLGHRPKVGK